MSDNQPPCRIYLILPEVEERSFVDHFELCLEAADIACVLLKKPPQGLINKARAKQLMEITQRHNIAFLIEDDAELARKIGADGVHLSENMSNPLETFERAHNIVGDEAIIGTHCGPSRHYAMELAEAGADYIAIGSEGPEEARWDMIGWWAELCIVPCVAWDVKSLDEGQGLAFQGEKSPDFIALDRAIWSHPLGPKSALEEFGKALASTEGL